MGSAAAPRSQGGTKRGYPPWEGWEGRGSSLLPFKRSRGAAPRAGGARTSREPPPPGPPSATGLSPSSPPGGLQRAAEPGHGTVGHGRARHGRDTAPTVCPPPVTGGGTIGCSRRCAAPAPPRPGRVS